MTDWKEVLRDFCVGDTVRLDTDGYIGIPVERTVYYRGAMPPIPGYTSTFLLFYVVGTAMDRVGTVSDGELITSMLARGYAVIVLDYLGDARAASPALDWSVQGIRGRMMEGEHLPSDVFPSGTYYNTLIVPSGCDVSTDHVFWSIDRHGADGTLEKIVEIWNHDFRGVKGEILIPWTDATGRRKATCTAFDGSVPIWLNERGEPDEAGGYLRVKHTYASCVEDCVRPDGSPLLMDLFMHIVYPANPRSRVPVMCLASSAEHLAKCAATSDRPHLNGFAFRGYATVLFDYAYTPMARCDHYGYFDGNAAKGHVTGDNTVYSIQFYNDKLVYTAAMRYIRYLSLTDERFLFDAERIGVFGNSKGGWTAFLGEEHPELLPAIRMLPGHYGETRYENGKTRTVGSIRGGEEQPWLLHGGNPIDSGADLVYSGCGGTVENITEGHAPTFITCNSGDNWNSYYGTSNQQVNICRTNGVRALWFDVPIGHTLVYGQDRFYGVDTYSAFFDFAGYYLQSAPIRIVYTHFEDGALTVQFSGDADAAEIKRLSLTDSEGGAVAFACEALYGGTQWRITPDPKRLGELRLSVPADFKGSNGAEMGEVVSRSFLRDSIPAALPPVRRARMRVISPAALCKGEYVTVSLARRSGETVFSVDGVLPTRIFPPQVYYQNPFVLFTCPGIISGDGLTHGKRFRVSMRIFDTSSRYLEVYLNSATSKERGMVDYRHSIHHVVTRAGEWTELSFLYTVYEPSLAESGLSGKMLTVKGFCNGARHTPILFSALTVTEYDP